MATGTETSSRHAGAGRSSRTLPEVLRTHRGTLLRGAVLLLLLAPMGLAHLKTGFLAQLAVTNSPGTASFSRELTSPDALARLARKEHLVDADYSRALALYKRALEHFVLHVPSWLGLVDLYNDMGRRDEAVAALRFVEEFSPDNEETVWARTMLAHALDREEIMAVNLVDLADRFPSKHPQVFALADMRWPDPAVMMDMFGPEVFPAILAYYIAVNDAPKAAYAWRRVKETGTGDRAGALRYVNYLLTLGEVEQAAGIWRADYLADDQLLYNPGLVPPFLNSGFGWRISRADGVDWLESEDGRGLRIRFDGSDNPAFRLAQIVPLAPGRYVFSGRVESRDLTTDQRPYWSVAGYDCEGRRARGEMVPASGPAGSFVLEFNVPDGCHAVQIALRRNKSYYFDNKIAGELWIGDLALAPAPPEAGASLAAEAPGKEAGDTGLSRTTIGIRKMQVYSSGRPASD
ncbi:MAG TPA: tetratricopeptide repeat protein [Desulfobacteraceae bacterium]|nr:tetratricopeptide repeat protein [Desulfobacteraceae bacterium]